MKKNLVLLGMMGVGKSTLGKIVAKKQRLKFIDTDINIERKCLMKIPEIFEKKGEKFFREQEEKEVLDSLKKNKSVIAIGGGAFINKSIREKILKESLSIWLDLNLTRLSERIIWNKKRPLLNNIENNQNIISKLYAERKNIYKLADYKLNCNNLGKKDIIKKIIDIYESQKDNCSNKK